MYSSIYIEVENPRACATWSNSRVRKANKKNSTYIYILYGLYSFRIFMFWKLAVLNTCVGSSSISTTMLSDFFWSHKTFPGLSPCYSSDSIFNLSSSVPTSIPAFLSWMQTCAYDSLTTYTGDTALKWNSHSLNCCYPVVLVTGLHFI